MPSKIDPFPTLCMLYIMLRGYKKEGYEVIDIFTNQDDHLELVISRLNGNRTRVTLAATVKEEKVI